MNNGYSLVFLEDLHLDTTPTEDGWKPIISNAAKAALKFCDWFQPDETVIGGDFIDFPELAKQDQKDLRKREGKRLVHDLALGNQILDRIDKFTRKKVVFEIGNHDNRLDIFLAENPKLEGLVSLEINLKFKERGYEVIPFNHVYHVGHARFIHGWYYNLHHSKKTVIEMGDNIFYGHSHDVQSFTKVNHARQPLIGHSMGCLCDLDPEWRKGRPNRWVNGFGVFYFFRDGGFTFYNPIIVGGRFIWDGKIFDGGK